MIINEDIIKLMNLDRNIITAYPTGRPVVNIKQSWAAENVPLDASISVGNKLSISNGKIVIGKGIKKVKCSCIINTLGNEAMLKCGLIFLNNEEASAVSFCPNSGHLSQAAYTIANRLIEVKEGDTISLGVHLGAGTGEITILGDNGNGTYLTVEVVE